MTQGPFAENLPNTLLANVSATVAWTPLTPYGLGQSVTPLSENDPTPLPQHEYIVVRPGLTGNVAPIWPNRAGVELQDNTVIYLCAGVKIY